jgi:hypothetical protein
MDEFESTSRGESPDFSTRIELATDGVQQRDDILSSLLLLSQAKDSTEDIDDSLKSDLHVHEDTGEDVGRIPSVNLSADISHALEDSPGKQLSKTLALNINSRMIPSTQTVVMNAGTTEFRTKTSNNPLDRVVEGEKHTPKTSSNSRKSFTTTTPTTGNSGVGGTNTASSGNDKALTNLSTNTGNISLDDLRRYFHLPIAEVARQLGTCTTALKKICRKLNISKWPYRQILSLTKSIQSLEMASLNDNLEEELKLQYKEQIMVLQKAIGEVLKNPNKPIDSLNLSNISFANHGNGGSADLDGEDDDADQGAPEVDIDVQHIIKAAAKNIAQPERMNLLSSTTSSKKQKGKRKQDGSFEGGEMENGDHSSKQPQLDDLTKKLKLPVPPSFHSFTSLSVDFSSADFDNGAHGPLLEVGNTKVQHNPRYENQKYQFSGPVQLAPLVRKKMRPNPNRRVVPLMEPDIGSNYAIEFIPQLIVNMLHKSLNESPSAAGSPDKHHHNGFGNNTNSQ